MLSKKKSPLPPLYLFKNKNISLSRARAYVISVKNEQPTDLSWVFWAVFGHFGRSASVKRVKSESASWVPHKMLCAKAW